jgi:hypothetical protein
MVRMRVKLDVTRDPEQIAWLKYQGYHKDSFNYRSAATNALKQKILGIAGIAVILVFDPYEIRKLNGKRAKVWRGYRAQMIPMERNACHWNAVELWKKDAGKFTVCTGYALSRDGLWRQHSWCINNATGRIVETTESRVLYFGFEMTRKEIQKFDAVLKETY